MLSEPHYGPARLFGLQPAQELFEQQLADAVADALPRRCAETGGEPPNDELRARLQAELVEICKAGLAELLIVAQQVGVACRERGIPLVARGPATCTVAPAPTLEEAKAIVAQGLVAEPVPDESLPVGET